MADRRRVAATSGRVVTGVLGVALFAGAAFAVGQVELPVVAVDVPRTSVTPTASDQTRLCPGPLLRQEIDASSGSFGAPAVTLAAPEGSEQTALSAPDNISGDQFGLPTVVTSSSADGEDAPLVAAAQSQSADLDDLTGFAATACGEVSADSWLVAGSTDVGRTSLLSLSNPTRADAVIDLSFFGETGEIEAPGAGGIIVQAGESRVFSVASFAPSIRNPVIRVRTTGGQVYATLQHSVVRGITPGGVELSAPTAPPAITQVLPGVVIPGTAPTTIGETYDDSIGALRLLVPGADAARVVITFASESGGTVPEPLDYAIEAGVVNEIPLSNLAAGSYSISMSSDVPIVAAARTTAAAGDSGDFAWFVASAPIDADLSLAVAQGQGSRLHLFNPTDSAIDVTLTGPNGAETGVAVPAGDGVVTPVRGGAAYTVSGAEGVHAQISFEGAGGFSAYGIQPANPLATPVTVYPR